MIRQSRLRWIWWRRTINNADHILAVGDLHRFGVDHGLTFHSNHKLRTVLWGSIGEA